MASSPLLRCILGNATRKKTITREVVHILGRWIHLPVKVIKIKGLGVPEKNSSNERAESRSSSAASTRMLDRLWTSTCSIGIHAMRLKILEDATCQESRE